MKVCLLLIALLPAGGCMTTDEFFADERNWFEADASCPCHAGAASQVGRITPVPSTVPSGPGIVPTGIVPTGFVPTGGAPSPAPPQTREPDLLR